MPTKMHTASMCVSACILVYMCVCVQRTQGSCPGPMSVTSEASPVRGCRNTVVLPPSGGRSKANGVSPLRAEEVKTGQGIIPSVAWGSSLSLPQGSSPNPRRGAISRGWLGREREAGVLSAWLQGGRRAWTQGPHIRWNVTIFQGQESWPNPSSILTNCATPLWVPST